MAVAEAEVGAHVPVDSIIQGDAPQVLRTLPSESVQCVVTSPPYFGLRDYGVAGQFGLEPTVEEYVATLVAVFREVRRVLRDDGVLWLNLGDSYFGDSPTRKSASEAWSETWDKAQTRSRGGLRRSAAREGTLKPKDLIGIPWRVAFALQADGWWLRSDVVWVKPNCMPESVTDRPTKAHEYVFLLSKSQRYFYDADAIKEPMKPERAEGANAFRGQAAMRPRGAPTVEAAAYRRNSSGNKARKVADGTRGRPPDHLGTSFPWVDFPGNTRNKRDVWTIATAPYKGAHFAVMPPALVEPCILAGCPAGGMVLDPFFGAGTVGVVAKRHGRHYLGIELNPEYVTLAEARIAATDAE